MSRKTIIFDFDGTIADSMALAISIFAELLRRPPMTNEQEIADLRQLGLRQVIKKIDVPRWRVPYLIARGRRLMQKRMDEVDIFEGIETVLRDLHKAGYSLFIISSNSTKNVKAFLDSHKLLSYFDQVHGGVGVFDKAAALRKAIRINKIKRETCYYVGDEVRDIEAARRAHVKMVSVAWGYNSPSALESHKPFAIVQKPEDLLSLLVTDNI